MRDGYHRARCDARRPSETQVKQGAALSVALSPSDTIELPQDGPLPCFGAGGNGVEYLTPKYADDLGSCRGNACLGAISQTCARG